LFDSLIDSRSDRKPFWRPATFAVALGLHGCVLAAVLVENCFQAPPVSEPPIHVMFSNFAAPPALPAPASPMPAPEAPKRTALETPPPMLAEMVQPSMMPDEISVEPMLELPPAAAGEGVDGGVADGVTDGVTGGVLGGVLGGAVGGALDGAAGGAPAALPLPAGPLRVGGDVLAPVAISQAPPEYPMMARNARVEGDVKLEAVIRRDGTVGDIKVVQGLRMGCTEAAIDALKRWRFRPGTRNGVPVDVYYTLTVGFTLG
jgi:protein TonB